MLAYAENIIHVIEVCEKNSVKSEMKNTIGTGLAYLKGLSWRRKIEKNRSKKFNNCN